MPFAFIDLDLLDENIASIARRASGKPVRIASKSVRCISVLKRILAHGAPYQGIMAYSAQEAAFLSAQGFDDLLIGYPCYHPQDIQAVLTEVKKGKTIRFMADSVEHIRRIDEVAAQNNVVAEYCLDIDMSTDFPGLHFGVYRSPLHTAEDVKQLFERTEEFKNSRLAGIMGYEAQVAGVGDNVPGAGMKNAVVRVLKKRSIKDLSQRRGDIVQWLKAQGADLQIVNAGGTGSLETSAAESWVTEVTAGSGFYSSGLFDSYTNFHHRPAAAFAVEIVRQPKEGMFTCLGGGYIASGEVGVAKQPKPYLPDGMKLVAQEGCGEVQTPFFYSGQEAIGVGDPVFFRHAKAGELCERFNSLYLVQNGKIEEEVKTYRGEGECYL